MKGLSPSLRALDESLKREHDERRRNSQAWAELPPVPEDPTRCRWCGGQRKALIDGDPPTYCERGCADNDQAPYLGHCLDCGRQFHTGKRAATICYICDKAEAKRIEENGFARPYRGRAYNFSRTKRGSYW